jgi:hypothetical protein
MGTVGKTPLPFSLSHFFLLDRNENGNDANENGWDIID